MTNPTIAVPVELLERSAQMIQFYVEYLCATNSEESDIELAGECVDELRAILSQPADHSEQDLGMVEPTIKSLTVAEQPAVKAASGCIACEGYPQGENAPWHVCGGVDPADQPSASDQFCDGHCTWLDHHPDCAKSQQPSPDHLPPLIKCLRENGQQIAERAFDAQEGKYPQAGQAGAVPTKLSTSEQVRDMLLSIGLHGEVHYDHAKEIWNACAGEFAAAPKAPEGRELVPLLVEARQAMLMHWKPKSVNAGFIRASLIERIDAALSAAQAGGE